MKRSLVVVLGLVLVLGASAALAAGGGLHTGASPQNSTSAVNVNIPGVIGIDVETDMTWDFGAYTPQPAGAAAACPSNQWPLQPNCIGSADYTPNASATTTGAPNPSTNAGAVWIAVFSNIAAGTPTLNISAPALSGGTPWTGYAATNLYYQKDPGATFNVPGAGAASWTSVPTSATSMGIGTLTSAFNWTRVDQDFKFTVPSAGAATFTPGTYTTTVTFAISHS